MEDLLEDYASWRNYQEYDHDEIQQNFTLNEHRPTLEETLALPPNLPPIEPAPSLPPLVEQGKYKMSEDGFRNLVDNQELLTSLVEMINDKRDSGLEPQEVAETILETHPDTLNALFERNQAMGKGPSIDYVIDSGVAKPTLMRRNYVAGG